MMSERLQINVGWPDPPEVKRDEIEEAMKILKVGKAPGADGITSVMLEYGGVLVECMLWICNQAQEQAELPEDQSKTIVVLLYKGKRSRGDCDGCWGISLFNVAGKMYERILNEEMKKITKKCKR